MPSKNSSPSNSLMPKHLTFVHIQLYAHLSLGLHRSLAFLTRASNLHIKLFCLREVHSFFSFLGPCFFPFPQLLPFALLQNLLVYFPGEKVMFNIVEVSFPSPDSCRTFCFHQTWIAILILLNR